MCVCVCECVDEGWSMEGDSLGFLNPNMLLHYRHASYGIVEFEALCV